MRDCKKHLGCLKCFPIVSTLIVLGAAYLAERTYSYMLILVLLAVLPLGKRPLILGIRV